MKIHKLNAISSTNDYLKSLVTETTVDNYTVVSTDYQTSGKGQMQNKWHSKRDKNLLVSVLVRVEKLKITNQYHLNFAISLAIFEVVSQYIDAVKIKWPNDILSRKKKLCGILIENVVKNDKINYSIVGIGLNVNQVNFPKELKNVTSLKLVSGKRINRNKLLKELVLAIQKKIYLLENHQFELLKNDYLKHLYRIQKPAMFKDKNSQIFMGKIIGVDNHGKLQMELDDESLVLFAIKEVSFI